MYTETDRAPVRSPQRLIDAGQLLLDLGTDWKTTRLDQMENGTTLRERLREGFEQAIDSLRKLASVHGIQLEGARNWYGEEAAKTIATGGRLGVNEYGTLISLHHCWACGEDFTLCPPSPFWGNFCRSKECGQDAEVEDVVAV